MMAYRSSVHESTGYTPQVLVHSHEVTLFLDLMFPNPNDYNQAEIHDLFKNGERRSKERLN